MAKLTSTRLRLACVSTIFLDFEYAASEAVEDILWRLHSSINDQYRRILQKLKHESRVVERRKVEAKYGHFLRVGQSFYLAYIQRLALRYDLPGLKRVARDIQAEEKDAKDIVCPAPELAAKVLDSCHLTLIHMGDLARYRVQAKQKKSFDAALTFYSLAHTLVPDSGYPYHQMGIVGVDQTNHLDVIYHFYRAWAVRNPHPMARKNLESRLRDAQKQNATSRGKPASPSAKYEALTMWFVRLHALFYKGEAVSSQHRELEREVIHRLSIAAKDTTKDGNVCLILLKMSLVNMSACWAASAKYNGTYPLSI